MTVVCARSRRIQFRDARITHNHATQAGRHGARRQAIKVAANCCRNNRCNTPRWGKFEQAKHEAYLPLSSKTRREIKARDTSSEHLKITRTFQLGKTRTANNHSQAPPRQEETTHVSSPLRSEAHNTPAASPLQLLHAPESETPVDYGYQRGRTSGKTLGKTRCHAKTVRHVSVKRQDSSNAAHVCKSTHNCEQQHTKPGQSQTSHQSRAFSTCSKVAQLQSAVAGCL